MSFLRVTIDSIKSGQSFEDYIVGMDNGALNTLFEDYSINQLKNSSPITLIGESKCGKTHLLNAMHIFYSSLVGEENLVHTDCVELMNDIMADITQDKNEVEKYESAEILLIDNIHCLWGKERLQELVYKLVTRFIKADKLVVFTLDSGVGYDTAIEEFKELIFNGLTIEIKPLTSLYLYKLNKKLEKEKEPASEIIKKLLNDEKNPFS